MKPCPGTLLHENFTRDEKKEGRLPSYIHVTNDLLMIRNDQLRHASTSQLLSWNSSFEHVKSSSRWCLSSNGVRPLNGILTKRRMEKRRTRRRKLHRTADGLSKKTTQKDPFHFRNEAVKFGLTKHWQSNESTEYAFRDGHKNVFSGPDGSECRLKKRRVWRLVIYKLKFRLNMSWLI